MSEKPKREFQSLRDYNQRPKWPAGTPLAFGLNRGGEIGYWGPAISRPKSRGLLVTDAIIA